MFTLVDPDGTAFFSRGVNVVSFDADEIRNTRERPYRDAVMTRYGSREAWARATVDRLREWRINTIGSWSSYEDLGTLMPYTVMLEVGQANWGALELRDYYSDQWIAGVRAIVARLVVPRRTDRNLVGWFLDNEMHWGPDVRVGTDLFTEYFAFPPTSAGRRALIASLRQRNSERIESFNARWGTTFATWSELESAVSLPTTGLSREARDDKEAFLEQLAEQFFRVVRDEIHSVDTNHMLLGVRFVSVYTPRAVVRAAGRFLDVVSVNSYEFAFDPQALFPPEMHRNISLGSGSGAYLQGFATESGRAILITEFGFRAADTGLPNSAPPIYPTLATQTERANRFEQYVSRVYDTPHIVGHHWFQYMDQPVAGRFDGEDNNWGLVTIADEPYVVLTDRMRETAARRPF